jgi:hypothetical protein
MDAEKELRKVVASIKEQRAQAEADAIEQDRVKKYVDTTTKQAADEFVYTVLPGVVAEMRPMVPGMWAGPVAMPDPGPPLNQFHGDFKHHDWTYSFRVGHGEAQARACGHTVGLTLTDTKTGKKRQLLIEPSREAAIVTFNTVVKIGLS